MTTRPAGGDDRSVLGKAFRILAAFQRGRTELTLAELADLTELPKPTAHRLAGQLVELGALERSHGQYRLGLTLFELGGLVVAQRQIRERAQPFLEDLYEATHETVHLGVLDGDEVVYVDKISGHKRVDVPTWVGSRMPLYCTGLGKAILAHSATPVVRRVLSQELARRTPYTIVSPQVLAEHLQKVREEGVAFDWEESTIGVACAAGPILDRRNQAFAAISVTGPMNRIDPERVVPALRKAVLGVRQAVVLAVD